MAGSRYGDGAEISGSLGVTGSATFNDESKDVDFRVESDGNTHMLFVDASADAVGIGTSTPDATLEVANASNNAIVNLNCAAGSFSILQLQEASTLYWQMGHRGSDNAFYIRDSNGTTGTALLIEADSPDDSIYINSTGVGINKSSPATTLHVAGDDPRVRIDGDANSHPGLEFSENGTRKWIIFNDYTNDNLTFKTNSDIHMSIDQNGLVGIGTTSPKVPLDIYEMGGLIIGYTMLNNNDAAGNASYQLTTSYVVPTSNWKVTFKAPASGKVEIQFLGYLASAASGNDYVYLGLSDNSTYNSLGSKYERQVFEPDEDDNIMLTHSWYVAGLTPGTTYTYYVGTKGTSTAHYWFYGGTNSGENPPIIIRAVSLPNTVHTD